MDSLKSRRLFRPALLVVIFSLQQSWQCCEGVEQPRSIVDSALEAEIDLDNNARDQRLELALQRDARSPEAHWARGDVRIRDRWMSLDDAAEVAQNSDRLNQYRELRGQTDDSIRGQIRLAEFCRKHALPAQERVHWNAVLALAPNHVEARQRLGQVRFQGMWTDKRTLENQTQIERDTGKYLRKHGKELFALAASLFDKSRSREDVMRDLKQFRDPLAIAGLEQFFSNQDAAGALCTVDVVASLPMPEASLSLIRHALDYSDAAVRQSATRSLGRRDEQTFVPVLLAALKTPVTKRDQFTMTRDNQLVWRRSVSVEMQETKNVATLDRIIPMQGLGTNSVFAVQNWTQQMLRIADLEVDELNRNILANNDKVMRLLSMTTDDNNESATDSESVSEGADIGVSKSTPEEWWSWWNAKVESYPTGTKVIQTRYESVVLPPSVPEFTARRECLAPGTLIWTETGPIAIERIQAGDLVLAQNPRSGELKFAPVLLTTQRSPEPLFSLKFANESVRATGGHLFWVSGQGWIKSRSLKPGMGLHTPYGVVVLDSVDEEVLPTRTHNLIVDDFHSYFVGTNLILSHDNTNRQPVVNRVPGLSGARRSR